MLGVVVENPKPGAVWDMLYYLLCCRCCRSKENDQNNGDGALSPVTSAALAPAPEIMTPVDISSDSGAPLGSGASTGAAADPNLLNLKSL